MQTDIPKGPISRTDSSQALAKLLLFIIWPFGMWLYCIKHSKSHSSYIIFFFFSLLICWHMAPYITLSYDDFLGILSRFEDFGMNSSTLSKEISDYFTFKASAPKEIYEIILTYFVKSFTDNYHVFFLMAGIPIVLCQLKSMSYITFDKRFVNGSWFGFWLLVMFIFPRDIITVQNPRFATGFWLCIVGTICYFLNDKKKLWIIPILLAAMCHSGLWVYSILFILYLFIPHKIRILEICAICSMPFAFLDADIMSMIDVELLPQNFQHWASIYLSDEAMNKYVLKVDRAGFWWVQASFELLMKCTYFIMTVQLLKHFRTAKLSDSPDKYLYPFYLFVFAFINLIQFVPEMGGRYFWFIRVLSIIVWFKAFGNTKKNTLYLLVCSCSFLMLMRYGYVIGGALSVTTNPDLFFMPLPYLMGKGLFWELG